MASHDESFSTSTELALMFGNFFGVAEADNLSIDTDSSGTATENFDQTPQANIISGRQTGLDLTDNGTQPGESTTTPNLLAAQTPTSTINVNYNGFSTQAQAAFEYAVDIWENLIVSPVPIEVEANWTPLGKDTNILGSAGPNDYDYNFDNAAYANTLYPIALANSLAGSDLDPTAHDINANFNSNYSNWYFGTDGNTPTGKTDFVSVVLHELGHGLGFSGSMDYDFGTGQGSWWNQPVIYDHFTVNGSGQKLIDTFPNNSVALGNQLISNNLFFNGSNAVAANGGTNPKLYAPSRWELGSSYAHLDGATYGSGSSNALMTPSIAPGEAHHDPGAVTLGIFEDLGWVINLADLWGWDFHVTPQALDAGDSFNIDFDITNTGSSAGAFDVSFYLSNNNYISTVDHFLGITTINGLAGNSTGSFTTNLNLPSVNHSFWNGDGTYYIGMTVDSGSDVTEVYETNNSNVGFLFDYDDVAINNTQLADLSGSDFDITPQSLDAGDSFNIDFDITNTGSSAGAFDVSFYLSSNNYISTMDHLLYSGTINGLAGNSTGSFTTSLNLPGVNHSFWNGDGTYYIGMLVDSGADVTEVNETNNSNFGFLFDYDDVVINNTQLADLSGSDFDVTSEPLDAGDSFNIDFDITNTGGSAGAFDVSFYLSSNNTISTVDHLLGSATINGLAGNSTGSFTTSLNLPGVNHSFWNLYGDDTYYIGMRVDSGADVTETNETNNSNVGFLFDYDDVVINNTQLADLSGSDFDVTSEPLDAGDSFNIDFDITNTGSSAGAFDVSFYLSSNNTISTVDQFLGSTTINGLAGNSTGSFTTSLNLPSVNHSFWNLYGDDTYYIGMRVDSGSDVTEVNETNNSNVGFLFDYDDVAINNTQLADLSGLDFDVTPEPLDAGDSFDIDFDITNTGSSAGAFDVSFYLSSNNTISTTDHLLGSATINGLAGNSTGSFTTSLNLPGVNHSFWDLYGDDTYYIGMRVDSGSDVTEVNETNNSNVGFLFDYDDVAINNTQIANLSGLNFNVTPEPLNAGDSFDIDLTIENSGAAAAGVFDVSLYLSSDSNISHSDLLLDTISFTGLAANSSGTFTSNFILPEANDAFWSGDGSYYIGMMVDSGDDITETIETDNANVGLMLDTDNVVINNTQLSDLVGVDFNLVQEPLAAGDHFDVNFEVQNMEMFAAGAFDVSFYVSTDNTIDTADQFLGSTTINGLAGNSIGAYTTGLTLPGINDSTWKGDGIYYIGMIIDQDGTLPETDETNNSNNGLFVDYDNVLISDTELIGTDDDDTLFGTPGDDILSGLRDDDDLVGGGGDDTLFGDRGDDNLFGEAGSDMLFGDRGDDYLFGGTGNDTLFGDRGDDLLIGVELNLANPGLGEVDSLIGGFGADVFQLGDVFSAYYDDADGTTDGSTDYALITDFDINQDIIELHGSAADYQLATVSPSLPSGIGVFLQSSTPSGQDELIGIVQGESSLSLNDSYFSFV